MMTIQDKLRTVVASVVKQLMACLLLTGLFVPAYGSQKMADEHKRWLKEKVCCSASTINTDSGCC